MSNRQTYENGRKDRRFFNETANSTHWFNTTKWVPRGGKRM